MFWCSRVFFVLVAVVAIAGLISGAACTRRGKSSPIPPTSSPLTTIDVNPKTGSDSTGDGTSAKPYKTLTKAVSVAKNSTTQGLTIALAAGAYVTGNGEVFPIVIPVAVTISGTGYGTGPLKNRASFINGFGEDTAYEKLVNKPPRTAFATLEVPAGVSSVSLNGLYIGASRLPLSPNATYAAADVLGDLSASRVTFAAATFSRHPQLAGVMVPSGGLNCTSCTILGNDYALLAFTLPNGIGPNVVLGGQPTQSAIGGKVGIVTDGTATVDAAYQTFQSREYGYRDTFVAPIGSPGPTPLPGVVDFGQGPTQSSGANNFIGASTVVSEISITRPESQVYALGDTWNPLTQGTSANGLYRKAFTFNPGAQGRNVTIAQNASASFVNVGPIPQQTPTPQPSPSESPSPSPSPT